MNLNDLAKSGNKGTKHSFDLAALKQAAEDGAEKASDEFRDFIDDIEKLLKKSRSASGKELEQISKTLDKRVSEAKTLLDEQRGAVAQRARQAYTTTSGYVREHPVASSTGVLAVLGAVCGYLWWRQR